MIVGVNALFIRPSRVGGAETMVHNLVAGLAETMRVGDSVIVLATDEARDQWPHADSLGAGVSFAPCGPGGESNRVVLETRLTRRFDARVDCWLQSNYYTPPFLRKPSVTIVHDEQFRDLPEFFSRKKRVWLESAHRYTEHKASRVVFISNGAATHASKRRKAQHTVIPNPVSWSRLNSHQAAPPLAAAEGVTTSSVTVLAVAAQYPHKRTDLLLEAWRVVQQRLPDATLELVGQTSNNLVSTRAVSLQDKATALGLRRVNFRGHVSNEDLAEAYAGATIFVAPSRYEGFGMPIIEALGMGLPVVATDLATTRELAPIGVAYLPLQAGAEAWAEAVLTAVGAPRLNDEQMSWYRQQYAPHRVAKLYWNCLHEAAEGPRR